MEVKHCQNPTEQQQQSYDSLMEQNQHTYIEKQQTQTQTQNLQESQVFSLINPYNDIEPLISPANTYNYRVPSPVDSSSRIQSTETGIDSLQSTITG